MNKLITIITLATTAFSAIAQQEFKYEVDLSVSEENVFVALPRIPFDTWHNPSDSCGGFKQSNFNDNVYFLRAKSALFNSNYIPSAPDGYRWLSVDEYNSLNPYATATVYSDACGHGSNVYDDQFVRQEAVFFNDWKHALNTSSSAVEIFDESDNFNGTDPNLSGVHSNFFGIVVIRD